PRAHREFVRLANEIALRKRHQRGRPDDTARLYQLEIIKLRMQIQEMSKIDRDTRRGTGLGYNSRRGFSPRMTRLRPLALCALLTATLPAVAQVKDLGPGSEF